LSEWAFEAAGLHWLELNHSALNVTSCRVAARLRVPREGTKRLQLQHADGWHDMHVHAFLAED
jgi:[ribosomal protein S5]-alanine N-acetyltransferase